MSTVRANNYYDASGGSNAQLYGVASPPNSMGFRNRILNGDCRIDQRNAGASVTPTTSGYTLDRWVAALTQSSKYSVQQSTTAPTGFNNSLLVTSLSAYSVAAGDFFLLRHYIEGFNFADLGWGSANAQTVTMSFWVRSSLTGTFGGSLQNSAENRSYPFTYTISAANTWEQKTLTIAGDTSGTWVGSTNGVGVRINFGLGAGATYGGGTAGAWVGADYRSATGATSVVGTNGATWYITGVQLEAGTVASPFERRDYGRELIMCQRYFEKSYNIDVAPTTNTTIGIHNVSGSSDASFNVLTRVSFAVSKRANPTVTLYTSGGTSGSWGYNRNGASGTSAATADQIGMSGLRVYAGIGVAWVVGNIDGHWIASAEL